MMLYNMQAAAEADYCNEQREDLPYTCTVYIYENKVFFSYVFPPLMFPMCVRLSIQSVMSLISEMC